MNKRAINIWIQVVLGILPLVAILTQFHRQMINQLGVVDFFSYFTNLSNILASFAMLIGAFLALRNKTCKAYEIFRGATVVYMAVVGVVFTLLLSGGDLGNLLPWVNVVLHYIMPITIVVYWFVYPPRRAITVKQVSLWLVFPAVYLAYSLIRGPIAKWYPYPFMNPAKSGGYSGVALYCLLVLAIFIIFGLVLRWGANHSPKGLK